MKFRKVLGTSRYRWKKNKNKNDVYEKNKLLSLIYFERLAKRYSGTCLILLCNLRRLRVYIPWNILFSLIYKLGF